MMVLVDTSVWVQHFKRADLELTRLLMQDCVLVHPMVIGEIACGTPPNRSRTLGELELLQLVRPSTLQETLEFIDRERLYGLGCGLVDLLLLVSVLITPGVKLWTHDRRMRSLSDRFDASYMSQLN